jgi:hypothetical protein
MAGTKTTSKRPRKLLKGKIKIADMRRAVRNVIAKRKKALASAEK